MARKPDLMNPGRESNGSQFYIVIQRQPSLDAGGGTVFGEVVAGLDVVDRIAALALQPDVRQTPAGANPCEHARIVRATLEPVPRKSAAR
jgi:cyclophilin family peptidyl-prolyl cis-trans isomerase